MLTYSVIFYFFWHHLDVRCSPFGLSGENIFIEQSKRVMCSRHAAFCTLATFWPKSLFLPLNHSKNVFSCNSLVLLVGNSDFDNQNFLLLNPFCLFVLSRTWWNLKCTLRTFNVNIVRWCASGMNLRLFGLNACCLWNADFFSQHSSKEKTQ